MNLLGRDEKNGKPFGIKTLYLSFPKEMAHCCWKFEVSQIKTFPPKYQITKAEYTMTDAKIGIQYQFCVKAENAVGVSVPSDASDEVTIYGEVQHIC